MINSCNIPVVFNAVDTPWKIKRNLLISKSKSIRSPAGVVKLKKILSIELF
ncbi:MAG TPA: hypothetical protein VFP25_01300 [Nitrososphaeraceae archaeon]|nr:hypothetical protein [Nitrososphaeraceae archaeon]